VAYYISNDGTGGSYYSCSDCTTTVSVWEFERQYQNSWVDYAYNTHRPTPPKPKTLDEIILFNTLNFRKEKTFFKI